MTNGLVRPTLAVWLLAVGCGGRAQETLGGSSDGETAGVGGEGENSGTGGVTSAGGSEGSSGGAQGASGGSLLGSGGTLATGGTDPVDPCEGVVATCRAGTAESCDAEGRLVACDECGRPMDLGESCARLLAADREGGLVCAVAGRDELTCVGGFVEWAENVTFPRTLLAPPRALALTDDSTSPTSESGGVAYCALDPMGSVSCTPEMEPFDAQDCTDVAASAPRACAVCGGELTCSDGLISETSVASVELADETIFWLNEDGTVDAWFEEMVLAGTYVDFFLSDHHDLCGIQTDGALACKKSEGGSLVSIEGDFVRGAVGLEQVCVINSASEVACFVLSAGALTPSFSPAGDGFVDVVATTNKACALTVAGQVQCWNAMGPLEFDAGPFL